MTRREAIEQYYTSLGDTKPSGLDLLLITELRALWAILDTVNDYDKGGTKDGYDAIWAAISEYNNELGGGE